MHASRLSRKPEVAVTHSLERGSDPLLADVRSTALAWALVASTAVHAGLAAAPLLQGPSGLPANQSIPLRATLAPPAYVPETADSAATVPLLRPAATKSPLAAALPPVARPRAEPEPKRQPSLGALGTGESGVKAELLAEMDRLGDLVTRQINEFPVEVSSAARLADPIVARYPPRALAEGREGSVAVWIVVNAEGAVEELHIADGEQEFASMVEMALDGARFVPAHDNLQPIRFPIALEFRFVIDGKAAAAGATAEAK